MATQHLIEQGHRRIAFVSGAMRTISRQRRFAGYGRALVENGIPLDEALVPRSSDLGDADSGPLARTAVHALLALDDQPTALVAVNDMVALSASATIRDAGRDIAEFAVVGFDDTPIARLISPALTSVQQPLREMAEAVVRLTVDGAGAGEPRTSLVFPPRLVVRASTERRIG
ncbi:substrate-binding domain-containing protein [Leifsonia xyli]|uniref:substrate-binding domain-containing protein n=1 Tax=Leifsonia xyli TaxID=1575 RepID=UPI003D675E51